MDLPKSYVSPFIKQCFVSSGASLSIGIGGLVTGFGVPLLMQLKTLESELPIDESLASWIVSMPALVMFAGNLLAIPIMEKYGRRKASLILTFLFIATWISITFTNNITVFLVTRAFQGIAMGMAGTLGSLLTGEYCSPRNRGAFLMTLSVSIALGVLAVHTVGSFMTWRMSAAVCTAIALVNLLIVFFSPESPSWLAAKGKYDDSMKVFRWLRGDEEEEELKEMIKASAAIRDSEVKTKESKSIIKKLYTTLKKKEFYKPVIIMFHINGLALWSGVNFVTVYAEDFINSIVCPFEVNISLLIITLGVHRVLANTFGVFIIKKFRRRLIMFTTVGINIFVLLAITAYTYAKAKHALIIDHPMIGVILTHSMIFTVATGSLPFCFIIAGEIFPLQFKNMAGGVGALFFSVHLFLSTKTIPICFATFGVYGTCAIYVLISTYCLTVVGFMLPETKDRTLQDIEHEFRGEPLSPKSCKDARKSQESRLLLRL